VRNTCPHMPTKEVACIAGFGSHEAMHPFNTSVNEPFHAYRLKSESSPQVGIAINVKSYRSRAGSVHTTLACRVPLGLSLLRWRLFEHARWQCQRLYRNAPMDRARPALREKALGRGFRHFRHRAMPYTRQIVS
jgi:hypothetical protein